MQRIWRQIIVLLIIVSFICTAILMFGSQPAKAQDDYTFDSETVNKGTSINPTYKNTEDAQYNTLVEGDQYADTNYSGSSEAMTYGTTGEGSFPTALDTDDATRRNYIEANQATAPYTTFIKPTSDTQAQFDSIYPAAATRLYFRETTAAEPKPNVKQAATAINANHWLTSTLGGGQDGTGVIYPLDMGATIGTTTSTITKTITEPGAAHYGWVKTYVSPTLSAQTISGTFSLSADYQEASTTRNMNPTIYIYAWNAADTYKSSLYAAATSTLEADTTLGTQQTFTFAAYTLTSTAVSAGDRIVIEMMFFDNQALTSSSVHGNGFGNEVSTGYASYIQFSMTVAFQTGDAYAATHFDKLDDAGTVSMGDGSTTYIYTATLADVDIFGMSDISDPGAGYNIDVTVYCVQRDIVSGVNNIQAGIRISTTNYVGITVDPTLNAWVNSSSSAWTLNPATSAEWTYTEVNALSTYLASSDATPSIYCSRLLLKIDVSYTANYQMQGTITYNSVVSSSQTTGYQVITQGYRSGSENFYVQAWNYTSSAWVTKTTVQAASDTDYNFNLLGWAANCERSTGNVVQLRLIDVAGSDTTQDTLYLDLLKIRRIEQGYQLDVVDTCTVAAQYGNITLRIKAYTTLEQFNVNVWNYTSSAYDANKLAITSLSNAWQTTIDLCDTHHRSTQTVKVQFVDATAAASDQVQDTLYLDVLWVTRYHTNPSISAYGRIAANPNLGDTITWWMTYTDYDNEVPSANYPKVHIDSTDYSMTENGTDTAYWDGKLYHFTKDDLAGGAHTYYFVVKDVNSIEITTAETSFKVNRNPTLTVDSVTPATGNNGESFSFYVTYTDADGDPPSNIKVNIASVDYVMTANGTGTYLTGAPYHYEKAMAGGTHAYYFKTKDANGTEVSTTPKNLVVNNPPILSSYSRTPSDPVYIVDELNFTCTYTDADNEAPTSIKWRETGISNLTMSEVDSGDLTYDDGKDFYLTMYLSHGIHTFDFYASDGMVGVSGGSDSITIQNRGPTIDNDPGAPHQYRNTYWEYDFSASDEDGDTIAWALSSNATFLNINSGSGLVYGTTSDPVAWYHSTVWANDSFGGSDSLVFDLYVDNQAPTITSSGNTTEAFNSYMAYQIIASDGDGDGLGYALSSNATFLSISGSWVNGSVDLHGWFECDVWANDSYGGSDNEHWHLTVTNHAPTISSAGNTSQDEDSFMVYHIVATDIDGDDLSYALSTNASFLSISGEWVNGTCTPDGWYECTIWVNDTYEGSDSEHWHLTVEPFVENLAPYFTSEPIYVWPNNTEYLYDVNAVDPEEQPIYYDLFGDIVALGFCTIDHDTGQITGLPHLIGDFSANVSAFDGVMTAWQNWSLHIYTNTPVFDTSPITEWQNGTSYLYEIHVHDPENEPLTWGLEGNCTSFLALDDVVGYIRNLTGNVPTMGWWYVNVSCFDGFTIVWQNFSLTALNTIPSFTTSPVLTKLVNTSYYYDANASDVNSDLITYSLVDSPEWLFVDENTGEVEGTATLVGDYLIHLRAWDGQNETWQNWTLAITEPPPPTPPTAPPLAPSGISLLIALGIIGIGAFVAIGRLTNRGKPAKKPKEKEKNHG